MLNSSSRLIYVAVWMLTVAGLSSCSWWTGDTDDDKEVIISHSIEQVWAIDVDGRKPSDPLSYSQAAVTGKGDESHIVIGGRDGRVHVYNLSGDELYRIPLLESSDSGAVALTSGLVVLGDTGAVLYGINALDTEEGQVAWRFTMSSPLTGVPVVAGSDVLVQTTDNRIYRINDKGEKIWSFADQPGGLGLYLNASPLFHDDHVYALLTNGDAISLDAKTGDLVWRKQLLLDNDAAFLANLKSPQAMPIWMDELTLDGNTAKDIVLFSFYQGDVFALSRADGSTLLNHVKSLKSTPLLAGDRLYMADTYGLLQALERRSGTILWQQDLSGGELVGPVLWKNSLWLANNRGEVFRVGLNGYIQGKMTLPGQIDRAPIVTPNGVLLHSSLGGLYLVR